MTDELEVEEQFATVPEWLLRANVSAHAKVVYAVIQRHGNTSGVRMPGRKELTEWMHCSRATISRAIAELEAIGAVRVTRSTLPVKGKPGAAITNNRYFLRVTDPGIAHVLPARGSAPVHYPQATGALGSAPVRHYRKKPLQPPPTPKTGPRSARPEVEVPVAVSSAIDSVDALCDELRTVRRIAGLATGRWTNRRIVAALDAALEAGYDRDRMRDALHAIALDPKTLTPGRLSHDGPWWDAAERRRQRESTSTRIDKRECESRDCDEGWLVNADGLPREKCPDCHPAFRGATA